MESALVKNQSTTSPAPETPRGPDLTPANDTASANANTPTSIPAPYKPITSGAGPLSPPHTQTQSTLAPTAEFTRIFLLAWIIRYIFRGASGALFEEVKTADGWRAKILNAIGTPGNVLANWFKIKPLQMEAAAYSVMIGAGSGLLSWRYSQMVKSDIINIFREAVGYEKNIPHDQVTFNDIQNSNNQIIRRTVQNYHEKSWQRLGTDALFFLAAPLRSAPITDVLLGLKGVQIFSDTWKRKTTLFEDLVTFINNKINPRNGLGQPITMGEVFDLYQHYNDAFHPEKMFQNVLSNDPNEMARWASSQPIFKRITELMNETYAYKHSANDNNGAQAFANNSNFALPSFIYMLGHDLIDSDKPTQTLTLIEIANRDGMQTMKAAAESLKQGATVEQLQHQFRIELKTPQTKQPESGKNGVLPKGSTMQLDQADAPIAKIDANSIAEVAPLTANSNEQKL